MNFPEQLYCRHTCIFTAYLPSTPLEQLCSYTNDAATIGNVSGTTVVE
jgi:hypothetical protein